MTTRRSAEVTRSVLFLLKFLLLNALLTATLAIYHPLALPPEGGVVRGLIYVDQIFAESVLMLIPPLVIGTGTVWLSPILGSFVGAVLMACVPAWYFVDRLLVSRAGLRLLDGKSLTLFLPVLRNLQDYISNICELTSLLGVFVLTELAFYFVARRLGGQLAGTRNSRLLIAGLCCLLLASAWHAVASVMVSRDEYALGAPHPLYILGIFDEKGQEFPSQLDLRCVARMVEAQPTIEGFPQRFNACHVVGAKGAAYPDVVMVVVESFRPSAIDPKTAPNLSGFATESLTSTRHYSAGNGTHLGNFGLLYGINALWIDRALDERGGMPALLPRLLGELGYYRIFQGSWPVNDWLKLDQIFSNASFDLNHVSNFSGELYEGDEQTIERSLQILSRHGDYAGLESTPLFLVMQCNATHWNYPSPKQDAIYPSTIDNPLFPPAPEDEQARAEITHRYLNSVHCMDRMLKPLMDQAKKRPTILLITGDHGESLGEDKATVHCTALTESQVRTPFFLSAPRLGPRVVSASSHLDVVPTILDLLDVTISEEGILHGRSLIDPVVDSRATPLVLCHCIPELHSFFMLSADAFAPRYGFYGNPLDAEFRFTGKLNPTTAEPPDQDVSETAKVAMFQEMVTQLLGEERGPLPLDPLATIFQTLPKLSDISRRMVLMRLGQLGPTGIDTIARMQTYLSHEDAGTRQAAREAIANLRRFERMEIVREGLP